MKRKKLTVCLSASPQHHPDEVQEIAASESMVKSRMFGS